MVGMYKGCIYRHWHNDKNDDEKSYVGLHGGDKPKIGRWGKNGNGYKPQKGKEPTKFYEAIIEYGWASFHHDILEWVERETIEELIVALKEKEKYYISLYDSYHNGYNSTLGGEGTLGYIPTLEQLERRRINNEIKKIKSFLPNEITSLSDLKITKRERLERLHNIIYNFNRLKEIDTTKEYKDWEDEYEDLLIFDSKDFLRVNKDFDRYYKKISKEVNITVEQLISELYFTEVVVTPKHNSSHIKMTYEQSVKYGKEHDWIHTYDNCSQAKGIVGCYACSNFENEFKVHQTIMLDMDSNYPLVYKSNGCRNKNYVRFAYEPQDFIFDFNDLYDYETLKNEMEKEDKLLREEKERQQREYEIKREKEIEESKKPHYRKVSKDILKDEYKNKYINTDIYFITYTTYDNDSYSSTLHMGIMSREEYMEEFNVDLFEIGIEEA